jgi:integrase
MSIIVRESLSGELSYLVRVKDSKGAWYPSKTFSRRPDAVAHEANLITERAKGAKMLPGVRYTLTQYWDKWHVDKGIEWGISHRRDTIAKFHTHIKPVLGSKLLTDIDSSAISKLMGKLKEKKLSSSTRNAILCKLNEMLRDAVENDKLLLSNPVRKEHRAKTSVIERDYWTTSECYRFLDSVREHPYCIPFWIMVWNGLRIGEMIGLRHGDIDLENEIFHIKRQYNKNEYTFTERKNKAQYSPKMAPALAEFLRVKLPRDADRDSLVITNRFGGVACYKTLSGALTDACKAARLKRLTPHCLRHSMTGLWCAVGAGESDIRDLLGQKSTASARGYIHRTSDRMEMLAARLRNDSVGQNVVSIRSSR